MGLEDRPLTLTNTRLAANSVRLLHCRVGPFDVVFELRSLSTVEVGETTADAGVPTVDLRSHFGVDATAIGQSILCLPRTGSPVRVLVDAGIQLLHLPIEELFSFPPLLHARPALTCVRGVARLSEDGLAFLVDPGRLLDAAQSGAAT
jgi:hypothetical protein